MKTIAERLVAQKAPRLKFVGPMAAFLRRRISSGQGALLGSSQTIDGGELELWVGIKLATKNPDKPISCTYGTPYDSYFFEVSSVDRKEVRSAVLKRLAGLTGYLSSEDIKEERSHLAPLLAAFPWKKAQENLESVSDLLWPSQP